MKIAVLGSRGLLGREVMRAAVLHGHEPIAFPHDIHAGFDITDHAMADKVLSFEPHAVVNCTAFHQVEACEADPARAFAVNAVGPGMLARACAPNVTFVGVSTDYVFGGVPPREPGGYVESDLPAPLNVYGASKLAGEHLVLAASPRHIVVRTAALYGPGGSEQKGGSFPSRMLELAREGKPLRIVADQVVCPTYAGDLADAVVGLLEGDPNEHGGLYHLAGGDPVSWFGLALATVRLAGFAVAVEAVTTAELGAGARRPLRSLLRSARVKALPGWVERLPMHVGG